MGRGRKCTPQGVPPCPPAADKSNAHFVSVASAPKSLNSFDKTNHNFVLLNKENKMEENDKQERYEEYKRAKTQMFVEEENAHKEKVTEIKEKSRKQTIEELICFIVCCVPLLIFTIVQWCNGVFSGFNIVPFIIVLFIIYGNIKNLINHDTNPQNPTRSQINSEETQSYLEMLDKDKISNVNEDNKNNQSRYSIAQNIVTKILGCVLSLAFVVAGLVFYSKMVTKYKSDEYTIVEAEVVEVVDLTTTTGHYEDDEYVEELDDKCEVTFRYFDGTQDVEIKTTFKNTSYVKDKTMKIILRDGEFVATENKMIAGRFLLIYSIIAAALILTIAIIRSENDMLPIFVLGSIFLASGMLVAFSLQISNSALIHSAWISVPILLATVGFYWLIFTIYDSIKAKITHTETNSGI